MDMADGEIGAGCSQEAEKGGACREVTVTVCYTIHPNTSKSTVLEENLSKRRKVLLFIRFCRVYFKLKVLMINHKSCTEHCTAEGGG